MQTPKKVKKLKLIATCVSISQRKWDSLMENTTKASGSIIRSLIKLHLPDLYYQLCLEFYNPYESQCVKKEGLLIYVHSGIEYFLKYEE